MATSKDLSKSLYFSSSWSDATQNVSCPEVVKLSLISLQVSQGLDFPVKMLQPNEGSCSAVLLDDWKRHIRMMQLQGLNQARNYALRGIKFFFVEGVEMDFELLDGGQKIFRRIDQAASWKLSNPGWQILNKKSFVTCFASQIWVEGTKLKTMSLQVLLGINARHLIIGDRQNLHQCLAQFLPGLGHEPTAQYLVVFFGEPPIFPISHFPGVSIVHKSQNSLVIMNFFI